MASDNLEYVSVPLKYVNTMHELMVRSQRVLRYLGDEEDYSNDEIVYTFKKLQSAIDTVAEYSHLIKLHNSINED